MSFLSIAKNRICKTNKIFSDKNWKIDALNRRGDFKQKTFFFSSDHRWVRCGTFLALAASLNQIFFPILCVAGLCFTRPAYAMEEEREAPRREKKQLPQTFAMDEYHRQQLGDSLNRILGVGGHVDPLISQDPSNQVTQTTTTTTTTPTVKFRSDYCKEGAIMQEAALNILQLNKYGDHEEKPNVFPGYIFKVISKQEGQKQYFSLIDESLYGEQLSHYAFHSSLFDWGILPAGWMTLENVSILETSREVPSIDNRSRNVSSSFISVPYSYTVQVQAQPKDYQRFDQFLADGGKIAQLSPESMSTMVISHLLTGSKARLSTYGLVPDNSLDSPGGKLNLVLYASQDGVYPVIAEIAGGDQAFQHISHLNSDLLLIPELMDQSVSSSVVQKLMNFIPENVVLDWLFKLRETNDFYQERLNKGTLCRDAFLDLGLPLGVVRGISSYLCSTLYKIQECLEKNKEVTHDDLFHYLFPVLHAVYESLLQNNTEISEKTFHSPLEEILHAQVGPQGRLKDGRYVHDLLRTQTVKESMPFQKVEEAVQEFLNHVDLEAMEDGTKKQAFLTKLAKTFLQQGIDAQHESWNNPTFWQKLLLKTEDLDLLKLVLGRKTDPHKSDKIGNAFLHHLLTKEFPLEQLAACLTVLKDHGVNLDQLNGQSFTPLGVLVQHEPSLKTASLFAHLITLGAGHRPEVLPPIAKIVEFYHKLHGMKLWTPDVQNAFKILQYHHPKLAWALAVSEILSQEAEPIMGEVLEKLDSSLQQLEKEKAELNTKEGVANKRALLAAYTNKISILGTAIETLRGIQSEPDPSNPYEFEAFLAKNNDLKAYYQTQGIKIRGLTLGERLLPDAVKQQLWNADGSFKRVNAYGRRDVGKAELNGHVLYFKRFPELPGFEYAMDALHHQVIGFGTPWSDLVRIGDEPFLVSLGIEGENLHDVLKQTPDRDPDILKQLEKKSLQKLILMSMLTNPEDQKPDQLILERIVGLTPGVQDKEGNPLYRLISVDNDHALAPSVAKVVYNEQGGERERLTVQVKSALYCLSQMNEVIDEDVRQFFIQLNPVEHLRTWLTEMTRMDALYQGKTTRLFDDEEAKTLLQSTEETDSFVFAIPFRDHMIHQLHDRWLRLRSLLDPNRRETQSERVKNPTLKSILQQLEKEIGSRYTCGFTGNLRNASVWQRFWAIDGGSYKGHETSITSNMFLSSLNIPFGGDLLRFLKRNSELSPQQRRDELDTAIDLQQIAMEQNRQISVFKKATTSMARSVFLENHFKHLSLEEKNAILNILEQLKRDEPKNSPQNLYLQNYPSLKDVDFLQKVALKYVTYIDLSGNTGITLGILQELASTCKRLRTLILQDLSNLEEAQPMSSKSTFSELRHLDLSGCSNLHTLSLIVPKLRTLHAQWCPFLTKLALTAPCLRDLDLQEDRQVSETDFSVLLAQSPKLKKVQLQGCTNIPYAKITELDPFYPVALLEKCTHETKPTILKAVEEILKKKETLTSYNLGQKQLTNKDVLCLMPALNANTTLTALNLWKNQITDISPFANNTTLKDLDLTVNHIKNASSLARNSTLTRLSLGGNQIKNAAPFAANTTLTELDLWGNKIIDASPFSTNTTLVSLFLWSNKIIDVSSFFTNTTLTELDVEENQITGEKIQIVKEMLEKNRLKSQKEPSQLIVSSKEKNHTIDSSTLPFSLTLTGSLNETKLQFLEQVLPADNDCGFHGLGLDRNSAVQQLLRCTHKPEIVTLIAPEIKAAFIEGTIPLPMRGVLYNRLHHDYFQGKSISLALEEELDKYSHDITNYRFFIREHLGSGGWLSYQRNATSAMDALAKLNHLTVHIWQPSSQKGTLAHVYSTAPYGNEYGEKNTIHLFHTHKGTHYNRLEMLTIPEALSHLPFDPHMSLLAFKDLLPQIQNVGGFIEQLSIQMKSHFNQMQTEEVAEVQKGWRERFQKLQQETNHELTKTQINLQTIQSALTTTTQDLYTKTRLLDEQNVPYTGLSLDGGGIRGLVPAVMLRELERKARHYKPNIHIYEMFDYIGGTSVGGILGLGLTAPKEKGSKEPRRPIDDMVDLFMSEGSTIFQRTFWGSWVPGHDLAKPKFTAQGLEALLKDYLGDLSLSDSLTPIVITAVNHTRAPLEGFLFDTCMARQHLNHDFLMRDVGRGTSAAQTYFPEACIWNLPRTSSYRFSDGGPFLNNPASVVYNKIIQNFEHASHKNITILSLGTGEAKCEYTIPTTQGGIGWGTSLGGFNPLMFGQMSLSTFGVDLAMRQTLGNNYIRLQPQILDDTGNLKAADLAHYNPALLEQYEQIATDLFQQHTLNDENNFVRTLIEKREQRKDRF